MERYHGAVYKHDTSIATNHWLTGIENPFIEGSIMNFKNSLVYMTFYMREAIVFIYARSLSKNFHEYNTATPKAWKCMRF